VFGTGGFDEGRTAALARIAVQGELGHHQSLTAHVQEGTVHFALFVFKDAQMGYFSGQVLGLGVGIRVGDADQQQKAGADFGHRMSTHRHPAPGHPLDKDTHGRYLRGRKVSGVASACPSPLLGQISLNAFHHLTGLRMAS